VGGGLILLGIAAWIITFDFPASDSGVQPSSLPRLVASVLMILGAALAWKAHRAIGRRDIRRIEWRPGARSRIAASLAVLVVFVALLEHAPGLGFPVLAPPLMIVLGRIFGGRSWIMLVVVGIAISEGAYFFFHGWLGLVLPASAWF
jgi:hypothetical protein